MRALITGASGFLGRRLLARISDPVVLTRDPARTRGSLARAELFAWDPLAGAAPAAAFRDVQAVFHLAGESVAQGRWSAAKKERIRASREAGTSNLVKTLAELPVRPRVLVSASAIGFYGARGDDPLDETSAPGHDFLAGVCRAWESASAAATPLGVRVVNPRIGIVLGRGGGALSKMLIPFKLGAGGPLGNGRQWMSWIHVDDLVGLLLHAAEQAEISGPLNAVAPNPVTNGEFTRLLGKALHRPAFMPLPGFMLKLVVGEFGGVLLDSQRVVPSVALRTGYDFRFPELAGALDDILDADADPPRPVGAHGP
ncbi:MAG TPA: TIGR01777 family oxidoreductase [Pirellulales bacterium]|nr:TIGR01777 family oxidoreductase [Pirellulales bacterium]